MVMLWIGLGVAAVLLGVVAVLHLLPRLGAVGRSVSAACCRAPMLDVVVSLFTWLPWLAGALGAGWQGVAGAVLGQVVALNVWVFAHELAHRGQVRGPRIVKFLNMRVGRWRNHAALWVTVVVLPVFLLIRLSQWTLYPMLVWLLGFPRYDQGEWVNCSRQKFEGLVGHDLIWCLYCDWMTGVYSLGAECLRNVESFWCPIRFYDGKKCENCRIDFPDIDSGWVPADANMEAVVEAMQRYYPEGQAERSWWNHPARLTVEGQAVVEREPETPAAEATAGVAQTDNGGPATPQGDTPVEQPGDQAGNQPGDQPRP